MIELIIILMAVGTMIVAAPDGVKERSALKERKALSEINRQPIQKKVIDFH